MIGQLLGHFRILDKIGEGGMGVVYRARDEHLDRDVAIKVLPAGTLMDESARRRFRKEALALAKLNHPNIASVSDFDTQEGIDFLVMEYVPGVTLSDLVAAGPMAEKEIVRLGVQLAEALAAAHEQGVVHRDLKPGNLRLMPDGRLKILDFGLAKLVLPVSASVPTASAMETKGVAGTLPYMAPEQLRGDAVDARSDLYTAGTVLYEMATGSLPFTERMPTALADDILHNPPPPPGRRRHDLSTRLEEVILKCLEKQPENRYQSAKELGVDLKRISGPTVVSAAAAEKPTGKKWPRAALVAGIAVMLLLALVVALNVGGVRNRLLGYSSEPIRSLAVLPLENLAKDAEQEYFADGMTEELITNLSKISALRVISRTSVLQYKGVKKPLPQIAKELNVDAVVEGSVLRVGDRIRITAQLIRAEPEQHLWANSYDREFRDILALHSDVSRAIASEIRVTLTPEEQKKLASIRQVNAEAHEAYLRGRYFATRFRLEPLQKARQYLEQAVELDPNYAPAYAELAHVYGKIGLFGGPGLLKANLPKSLATARKAVELDPQLGQAHMMLAVMEAYGAGNLDVAWEEVNRALELEPRNPDVLIHAAVPFAQAGMKTRALAAVDQALALEPLNFEVNWLACQVLMMIRENDRALEQLRKTLELDPEFPAIHARIGMVYERKGLYAEAVAAYEKWLTLSGASADAEALKKLFAQHGHRGILLWRRQQAEAAAKQGRENPMQLAAAYAALGENEKAIRYLQKAIEAQDLDRFSLNVNPSFDGLRSDPRFQELQRRIGIQLPLKN